MLAIDLGTSGCKCAVVSMDGVVHCWAFSPVQMQIVGHAGAEQDPEAWWTAFLTSAAEVVAHAREAGHEISAICASTQGAGFRLGLSGAQGYFGVMPDLTVLGKCLTGGYPMAGAVGGKREIMMNLAGGIGGSKRGAMVGGTLSANPISCAAGYFAIKEMEKTNAAQRAGLAGDRLCAGLTEIIERLGLLYVAYNQGSIVHLQTSGVMLLNANTMRRKIRALKEAKPRKHMMEEFGAAYCAHGIVTLAGSRIYTSLADTDTVIDDALNRFEDVLKLV